MTASDQFQRTRLLLGDDGVDKLARAHVAVFGVGGVGGHVVEALARSGVGALTLVDDDVVDITNINRQVIATHATIGRPKVDVARERVLSINPACRVTPRQMRYLPQTADQFDLSAYDYVVDAVDTVTAKIQLVCCSKAVGVPVISSMGAGNKLDASRLRVADIYQTSVCGLAKVMRHELRKRGVEALKVVYSDEPAMTPTGDGASPMPGTRRPTTGSVAWVPAVAGLLIAGEVVRGLVG